MSSWQPPTCFLSWWIYLFWRFHLNGITQYMAFLSAFCHFFHMMFLKFTHSVAPIRTSFLFMNKHYSVMWISYVSFSPSSADGHLGCFCLFWVLWTELLWAFVYKVLCGHMFSVLLGKYLGVELLGHMVNLCLIFWGTLSYIFFFFFNGTLWFCI